jgi:hypothetical protein
VSPHGAAVAAGRGMLVEEEVRPKRERRRSNNGGDSSRARVQKVSASAQMARDAATAVGESEASRMACSRSSLVVWRNLGIGRKGNEKSKRKKATAERGKRWKSSGS